MTVLVPAASGWACEGGFSDGAMGSPDVNVSSCTDAEYPVLCPPLGSVPASCWAPGTICSSVIRCPDGTDKACTDVGVHYDCSAQGCVSNVSPGDCTSPESPTFCPALDGVPASCWPPGTACPTIVLCPDGTYEACRNATQWVNCETKMCIGTRNRVRGACLREVSAGSYSSACCPDVIREECLADPGATGFVPDAEPDYCQMHGYGENCGGACCYKRT